MPDGDSGWNRPAPKWMSRPSEGLGAEPRGGGLRRGAVVDAHGAELGAEAGLEAGARTRGQRRAGGAGHRVDGVGPTGADRPDALAMRR